MDAPCPFCRIVAGELETSIVYADERVLAFLDVHPINPGHVLVVPRTHTPSVRDLVPEDAAAVWDTALRVARALPNAGVRMEGLNLLLADGASAGQDVFHAHLHVVPRFAGDGFGFHRGPENQRRAERLELDAVAGRMRAALA